MNRIKKNKYNIFILTFIFIFGSFFVYNNFLFASEVNHVVISEVQIGGNGVYDEFIEIYNPTGSEINLENWDIKRKTKSGNVSNILNNIEGKISSYGYFLVTPRINCGENNNEPCYKGAVLADDEYTTDSFLANDNTILLYDNNRNLIDKIGWGEAVDFEGEKININPENGQSLKRININSAIQDTDNNKNDFILKANPKPQNSSTVNNNQESENYNFPDNSESNDSQNNNDEQEDSAFENETNNIENSEYEQEIEDNYVIPKIIITEFLPDPEDSDRDNEFIEIYNNGDKEVNLGDWTLEDKIGSVKKFTILNNIKIGVGKYLVFYSDETKITLNNSGDGVILKDNKNNIADETPISGLAKEGQSYALNENKDWTLTLRPTPGRKNIIKQEDKKVIEKEIINKNEQEEKSSFEKLETNKKIEYDYSDRIIISEIYPNPNGRDNESGNYEWIELYNNSDRDVNLRGWQIDDILNKGSKLYIIKKDNIIKAREYKLFINAETKIILNNSGDEVNILWPDGTVVDSVQYKKTTEEWSYSLFYDDSWMWNSYKTPGKENFNIENKINNPIVKSESDFTEEVEDEEWGYGGSEGFNFNYVNAEIGDIRHFEKYSKVKISGIISTPPEIFSDNVFYLFGSGIQVYSYEENLPKLNLGDEVEIIGKVSEIGGEKRILLENKEDLKILSHDNLVEPKLISTGNVNESVEGYLVMIEGKVSQIKSDTFYINDGSGEIKIYVKPQTKIKIPKIKKGDWMVVIGQVSRTSLGYRILPRFQNDIKLARATGISTAQASLVIEERNQIDKETNWQNSVKEESSVWGFIFFAMTTLVLIDWGRMRIKR
ncbi:MAG: lamin tail domain-containing protein [Patescibacteria group bacterium]|nr:lamin tail domain-containing protein [Patescibacteria group bacterium]